MTPTKIKDVFVIEPEVFEDSRGWFTESYNKNKLAEAGIIAVFVQDNRSFTKKSGTLRGLHLQNKPFTQAKLVSCSQGAVLDVAVDVRTDSPTYRQWVRVELSAENKKQLFVPRGFAHGFLTLIDNTVVEYKTDNFYNKASERSIRYDDPELEIDWGEIDPILLPRDEQAPFLKNCDIDL